MVRLFAAICAFIGCYAICFGAFAATRNVAVSYEGINISFATILATVLAVVTFRAMKD